MWPAYWISITSIVLLLKNEIAQCTSDLIYHISAFLDSTDIIEELLLLNFYKMPVILFPIKDQFDTQYVYEAEYNIAIKAIVF